MERLFSSSLLAIVSLSAPRKLKVCHFKKKTEICNNSYTNTILAVKLNRQRLIVCLEDCIHIHNIRDMKLLHTIKDTPPNPNGLCALSANSDNCYLAYPANNVSGEVNIFDAQNLQNKVLITAHDNPLAAIAFDSNGLKIATASEKVFHLIRSFGMTLTFAFLRELSFVCSMYWTGKAFMSSVADTRDVLPYIPYRSALTHSSCVPQVIKKRFISSN